MDGKRLLKDEKADVYAAAHADVHIAAHVRLRDRILSMISHDLRTPLNSIQTWTHVLEQHLLEPRSQEDAGTAQRALAGIRAGVEQQVRLLDDLLELTNTISGKLGLAREPFDLRLAARRAVEEIAVEAQKKCVRLRCDCPSEAVTIVGDRSRLQQAIGKLLSNAVDGTVAGGAIAAVVHAPSSGAEPMACVSLAVPERAGPRALLAILADASDSSGASTAHGAGLGLLLARALVELHGGKIVARSEGDNLGAMVSIYLPEGAA